MSSIWVPIIGLVGGLASGLFGVGGGAIFVPLLILLVSFNPHLAIGTSLVVIIPTAFVGAMTHIKAGFIDWKTALILVVFASLGAWFGAALSLKLDVMLLRRLFALFLVAIALKLFFQN